MLHSSIHLKTDKFNPRELSAFISNLSFCPNVIYVELNTITVILYCKMYKNKVTLLDETLSDCMHNEPMNLLIYFSNALGF